MSSLSLPPRLQHALDRTSYGLRRALTFWRRSIQARVVASTVLLSALVVSIVGWLLVQQIRDGLLENRVDQVVAEAENETTQVREQLSAAPGTDVDEAGQREDVVKPLTIRGAARGFAVILSPAIGTGSRLSEGGANFTQGLDTASVPESLQQHFDQPAATAWTYTDIATTRAVAGLPDGPGVVVGSQVTLPADDHNYML
jgi:two-component system, OmpR family, sensor histidine kinase MtrB